MMTKGYVTYAGSKVFGKRTLFSFRVNSEDKFFGTETTDPKVEKNDYIEFEYMENNGRFNVDPSRIKHINREESSANQDQGRDTAPVRQVDKTGGNGSNGYWGDRLSRDKENDSYRKGNDLRIQYQSARNASISVVDMLLRERILKLADSAKADNVAVVLAKIDDLTTGYMDKCTSYTVSSDNDPSIDDDSSIPFEPGTAVKDKWT